MADLPEALQTVLWLLLVFGLGYGFMYLMTNAAGWSRLQQRFPAIDDTPWVTLNRLSGTMGGRVGFNWLLMLSAGPAGLRMSIPRLYAPWLRPITVPWDQISARAGDTGSPSAGLSFGTPEIGSLSIEAWAWERLVERAPSAVQLPAATASEEGRALLRTWVVMTLAYGTILYIFGRSHGEDFPLLVAYGYPGGLVAAYLMFSALLRR